MSECARCGGTGWIEDELLPGPGEYHDSSGIGEVPCPECTYVPDPPDEDAQAWAFLSRQPFIVAMRAGRDRGSVGRTRQEGDDGMSDEMAIREKPDMAVMEHVIGQGDLAKLTPEQRVAYYNATCQSLGLNPLTKPFEYIRLNNRVILYATRGATDQLRAIHNVDLRIASRSAEGGVYVVVAHATLPNGRSDESTGVVSIKGLAGNPLANAYMKAETKAKRRVTLSIVGLGWLDESELHTIPAAQVVDVDSETGKIAEAALTEPESEHPGANRGLRPVSAKKQTNGTVRPAPPDTVKKWLLGAALTGAKSTVSEPTLEIFRDSIARLFPDADAETIDQNRQLLCQYVFNRASSKYLKEGEARAVSRWARSYDEESREYVTNEYAPQEAAAIVIAAQESGEQVP